jgi:bifunctional UDP-N-acetylglucosamine pyrophosphorylase/glucosamine-1-phosphate N-acetyltransferase
MKSSTPKVLFDVCGISSLEHVVRAARGIGATRLVVVVAPDSPKLEAAARALGATTVVQDPPLGTGHAVRLAVESIPADGGDVVVLYGDGPLFSAQSLARLLAHHERTGAAETLLTAHVDDPRGLGRIVRGSDGSVERIVEEIDADDATRAITEINTGILVLSLDRAREHLPRISNANKKGEYYLTDLVAMLRAAGRTVAAVAVDDRREALTFNSIEELASVRAEMRRRILSEHMGNGVDVVDPATTYVDVDVAIGAGTRILPMTVIGRGVTIGRDCVIGPMAQLREKSQLDDGVEIGNFVEVKKSRIGAKSKAKHLAYLGDAVLGKNVNVGCGTITANYDGKHKHETRIGDGAFVGSGTVLCAPAELRDHAMTGAGAVVRPRSVLGESEVWVGVPARKLEDASSRRRHEREAGGSR